LIEKIPTEGSDWVIDTWAVTFLSLMNYLIQNEFIRFLEDNGRNDIIHTLLVGEPAMDETIRDLKLTLETGSSPVVIWENEFFGSVARVGRALSNRPVMSSSSRGFWG